MMRFRLYTVASSNETAHAEERMGEFPDNVGGSIEMVGAACFFLGAIGCGKCLPNIRP